MRGDEGKTAEAQICGCQQWEEPMKKAKTGHRSRTNQKNSRIYVTGRKKTATFIRDHRKSQELSGEGSNWTDKGKDGEKALSIFPTNKA